MSLFSRLWMMLGLLLLPAVLVGCGGGPPVAKGVVITKLAGKRYVEDGLRDRIRVSLVGLPSSEVDRLATLERADVDEWFSKSHASRVELESRTIDDEKRYFDTGTPSEFVYTDVELRSRFGVENLDSLTLIVFADIQFIKKSEDGHDARRAKVRMSAVDWKRRPIVVNIASDGVSIGSSK